jgi:uncharacterized protein with GYD domain
MATFMLFGKYSAEAFKGISTKRTEKASELINKFGGEILSMYALLGERDLVLIVKFPDTESAAKASIAVSRLTGISFETSEAIPVDQFDKMVSDL